MLEVEVEWEGLDAAFEELEKQCAETVRGIAVEAWHRMLNQTPQFLGRMTASWSFCLGTPQFYDRSFAVDWNPGESAPRRKMFGGGQFDYEEDLGAKYKGHPVAIELANSFNQGKELPFQLGMDIYFTNGVDHGEGPYAAAVEDGSIRLRHVNQPGAPARRALDAVAAKYHIGVSEARGEVLRGLRIDGAAP